MLAILLGIFVFSFLYLTLFVLSRYSSFSLYMWTWLSWFYLPFGYNLYNDWMIPFLVETLINGKPIINLPPKTINLNKVDFTQEERSFYLTLEERSRQQFKVGYVFKFHLLYLVFFFSGQCLGFATYS